MCAMCATARKRAQEWIGYKVHLTEGCDNELPHLITQVTTAPATQQDHHALDAIQANLAARDLLPAQHLVDAGYISAKRILHSRDTHAIDQMGPVPTDPSWQARKPGALDVSQFSVDWGHERVTCPQGQTSVGWHRAKDAKGESVVQVLFAQAVCLACPSRSKCTDARSTGRSMTLRFPQARHEALQTTRMRQQTAAFKALSRRRAGIEGAFAQTTRNTGLRRARYLGMLPWHAQDPPAACPHRYCDQHRPARLLAHLLARRGSVRQDTRLTLRCPRRLVASSPTVSN